MSELTRKHQKIRWKLKNPNFESQNLGTAIGAGHLCRN